MTTKMLAVCHDCKRQHRLTLQQLIDTAAVRDWEMKHRGHKIEFVDEAAYGVSIANNAVGHYAHNADIKLAYGTTAAYTISMGSLATSATLTVGRQTTAVDNKVNKYLDFIISGEIVTGTSPTVNTRIEVIAIGVQDDQSTWPDAFGATDAGVTITNENIKNSIARFPGSMTVATTSDLAYPFGPISLAQLFGVNPLEHVLFVTHNTVAAVNATGHVLNHTPLYATAV